MGIPMGSKQLVTAVVIICFALSMVLVSERMSAGQGPKALRIIYTNDTLGYLEPCGCAKGHNDGGLARRATVMSELRAESGRVFAVDSGNLVRADDPGKLEIVASIYNDLGYDAVGQGANELRLGDRFFELVHSCGIPVIDSTPSPHERALPYLVKDVDGVKVGVVSFGAVSQGRYDESYAFRKALYGVYAAARKACDVLIVLDQANFLTPEWLERNGKRLGYPDVVVGGIARFGLKEAEKVEECHIVPTVLQGKQIGVVDLEIGDGRVRIAGARRIKIGEDLAEDLDVQKRVADYLLAQAGREKGAHADADHGSKAFYPSSQCKGCHAAEYEAWARSSHAKAARTLVEAQRTIGECLTCHSEEYRQSSRFTAPAVSVAAGVECATCHIASLPHGGERKRVADRPGIDGKMCLTCHTKARSPHFDQTRYLDLIAHGDAGQSKSGKGFAQPK